MVLQETHVHKAYPLGPKTKSEKLCTLLYRSLVLCNALMMFKTVTSNSNESGSVKVCAAVCSWSAVRNFGLVQTRKCHSSPCKDPSPAFLINNKEIT